MEKRKQRRLRRRLTCELAIGDDRHPALVRDLSPRGLFVQTRARLEPGAALTIAFPGREGQAELRAQARVARQRQVPPRLQASVPGGVGLELVDPPAALRALLEGQLGPEAPAPRPAPASGAAAVRTFRVRVAPRDKPGSRVITVRSESLHGARARALARGARLENRRHPGNLSGPAPARHDPLAARARVQSRSHKLRPSQRPEFGARSGCEIAAAVVGRKRSFRVARLREAEIGSKTGGWRPTGL